ncbi:MAG: tetratricopeptide repeat protein, partial [Desulfobacterales bacterium]|nr:tetratricopeptide repeat protein [Desulfobacterales bacterium]
EDAQKAYHRILTINPNHCDVLHLLGTIAYQTANYENAATLISSAIRNGPQNPFYYISLGDALKAQSHHNQAIICYQKAIEARPDAFEAYIKLGMLYHDRGNFNEAICHYLKALQIKPDLAEVHYSIGLGYQALNKLDHAISSYDKAIQLKPGDAEFHNNKGKAYRAKGDPEKALPCFQSALQLKSDFAEAYFNLADTLCSLGQMEAGIENYRRALRCRPDMFEAYNNLANALKSQGTLESAIKNYKQVVRLKPDLAEAYYNLGSTFRLKEEFDDAITNLKRALELKPQYAEAYNNLGLAYKNIGDICQATEYFSHAVRIKPNMAEAHWNRSFTYLLNENFDDGWKDYDWRFQQVRWKTLYPHRYTGPRWDGSTCAGKTLFVHDEQGLGDTLQFVRYLPMAKARCATIIFETRKELIHLLQGFPGIDKLVIRSSQQPATQNWDFYIPLLSLPKVFGTKLETIPNHAPYIYADARKIEYWKHRLDGDGFKVGIVWAGRPMHTNDHNRSCALRQFLPRSEIHGIQLIGLQKGGAATQVDDLTRGMDFVNLGEELQDFSDTAGLIENLDLVISVDTAVAHLAGAMGKAVWVLLPFIPDWRWMMDREDSPWYPSMRLFRQKTHGEWAPVFQRVEKELTTLVDSAMQRT